MEDNKKTQLPSLDDFLLNLQVNNFSQETIYNYERDLKVFEDFLKSMNLDFDSIDKKAILNYKAYLISQDRRTSGDKKTKIKLVSFSINRMLSAIRSYLKYLIDMDYKTPVSPTEIKLVRTEKKHARVSEFEEIKRLIESPSKFEKNRIVAYRNRAALETLFSTGLRISELISLKKTQVDPTGRIFVMGKGKKERFVYLTDRAQLHIKNYLIVRGIDDSPFLFIPMRGKNASQKDKKISPNYLEERVKKYRELLGLNVPITVHGIRHAFATYLAENGANPAAIQILLGHESLDTTTRYVHASDRYAEKTHHDFHPLKK
jgi:integrase/recombinase XerD